MKEKSNVMPQQISFEGSYLSMSSSTSIAISFDVSRTSLKIGATINLMLDLLGWFLKRCIAVYSALCIGETNTTLTFIPLMLS